MGRYNLEQLGWFHFERLIQALLKHEISLSIESWGGSGDFGRDAYCAQSLFFPNRGRRTQGPFVFQVKFVSSNVRKEQVALARSALSSELKKIEKRIKSKLWKPPKYFIFITNAHLLARTRNEFNKKINKILNKSKIIIWGRTDVEDLINAHESIRKAYPELLGIQDLQALIVSAVNQNILQRSNLAISEAQSLADVFVATDSYGKALNVLAKHNFVVLDGPPEMGKTAIARMISLQKLLDGFQVIECHRPDEIFSALNQSPKQIFIADDTFGRTEFDPSLGRSWERVIPLILRQIKSNMQLIWTSRKHILRLALTQLDLANISGSFPKPNEVIVDATDLSIEEKSLILYRHAKRVGSSELSRALLRHVARNLVESEHFTPERIRRFSEERLAEFSEKYSIDSETAIEEEVIEAIRNPTKRMRISFNSLPELHQWVLVSLIDFDYSAESEELINRIREFLPHKSPQECFAALNELDGTFVKINLYKFRETIHKPVYWIHPSYRDLVIDILSENYKFQIRFLEKCSVDGVSLALSESGGSTGGRVLPILGFSESWNLLQKRIIELITNESDWGIRRIIVYLNAIIKSEALADKGELREKVTAIAQSALELIEGHKYLDKFYDTELIIELYKLQGLLKRKIDWSRYESKIQEIIKSMRGLEDEDHFEEYVMCYGELCDLLIMRITLLEGQVEIAWNVDIESEFENVANFLINDAPHDDSAYPDDVVSDIQSDWSTCREKTGILFSLLGNEITSTIVDCAEQREVMFSRPDDDSYHEEESRNVQSFTVYDIPKLFSDL